MNPAKISTHTVQWWFINPDTFVPGRYFRINEFSGLLNRPSVQKRKLVPALFVRISEISGLSEPGLTNHHCIVSIWIFVNVGLIEGYSTERETLEQRIHNIVLDIYTQVWSRVTAQKRETLEQRIQDLEEKKEALVLDLETTRNKLQDLEAVHHEAQSLRSEMERQQSLMQDNVGDEAQGSRRYNFRYLVLPLGLAIGGFILREWVTWPRTVKHLFFAVTLFLRSHHPEYISETLLSRIALFCSIILIW